MQAYEPDGIIVVADDDPEILQLFQIRLNHWNYRCQGVSNQRELLDLLASNIPCLLILDLHLGDFNALDCLGDLLHQFPDLLIVILSGDGTIENAVAAVKHGAYDFLTKPVDWLRLRMILRHVGELQHQRQKIRSLEESLVLSDRDHALLGDSPELGRVRVMIDAIAPTDAPVLILGETGTGKELVARQLHQKSGHPEGPFIAVNMTALPPSLAESALFGHEKGAFTGAERSFAGCFERADGGTLFLDEIGDMDLGMQAKLLRVLQEKSFERLGSGKSIPVKCRLLAATNRDLKEAIRAGAFREDLYYRLNVVPIPLPPLRDHRSDIPLLTGRFARRMAHRHGKDRITFSAQALEVLTHYNWPGNVRQLMNLVERLVILTPPGTAIGALAISQEIEDVDAPVPADAGLLEGIAPRGDFTVSTRRMDDLERRAILEALESSGGNVRISAKMLGLSLATIYRKLKHYNISTRRKGGSGDGVEHFKTA